MSEHETTIYFGGEVKALGDGRVGGYLVRFTNPEDVDLENEYFDADTDFGSATTSATYYAHGIDAKMGKATIGSGELRTDDGVGVWIEAQLEQRNEYEQAIYELASAGKLGWSSGTAAHLVEKSAQENGAVHIDKWPLGLDASMLTTPAEPRNMAMPLKSFTETVKHSLEVEPQEGGEPSATTTAGENVTVNVYVSEPSTAPERPTTEVKTMSESEVLQFVTAEQLDDSLSSIRDEMKDGFTEFGTSTSKQLDGFLDKLSNAPALKDAGHVAPDSEVDHPEVKSFGDFLLAVRNKNERRLKTVYAPTPEQIKALGEQSGTTGGYLVPQEFEARLMAMAQEAAVVRPLATVIPVGTNSGMIPALDQGTAPTAGVGHSAFAGGVVAAWNPEAGALSSTDPVFTQIQYNINKLAGYTKVSNEMVNDSALAIDSLLSNLFGMAVAAMEDYSFLRGTGAGQPLGILSAPCTIAVTTTTNDQFAIEDCMNMLARFWPVPGSSNVRWILNRALIPDLHTYFEVNTAGVSLVQPREPLPTGILGYPIVYSEHMPAANSDDAILADLSAYVIFDRQGMQIAYSEHSAFTSDEGTWRFTKRLDGQPWLKSAITLADPGGATTVSPFLYHND